MKKRHFLASIISSAIASLSIMAPADAVGNVINFDFEDNSVAVNRYKIFSPDQVTGWQTTDSGIEIWGNGFQGVEAASGNNFAEINANINGILYQDLTSIATGQEIDFSFYHRARVGTDVMNFAITDLGLDNIFGSADDTVLFTKNYAATTLDWVLNDSLLEAPIIAQGNNVRVSYAAVSTGSGNQSIGNFLDRAQIGVSVNHEREVPFEVESTLGLLIIASIMTGHKMKRKVLAKSQA